ncbi:hypothetical protein HPB48_004578 [Haemaphysalis longicornis]|uniref:Transposase Tc1-like domain-containing protein n=1 Tax=Haemaphysalis longicornis TaxID=44386 RepID=A0A9J6FFI8_HAELO|nr:hypothetical protein HPB48_004578 [Haemaphysalis longicornis]
MGTTQVSRIIRAFHDKGRLADAARHVQRKTSEEEDRPIVALASAEPFMTAGQIREAAGLDVSDELVRSRLREAGLRNQVAAQKPLLSAVNKFKRLEFARHHLTWTVDDWQRVVFTDESTVCTQWDQKQNVYRPALMRFVLFHISVYRFLLDLAHIYIFLFGIIAFYRRTM